MADLPDRLDASQCWALLRRANVGRVAAVVDGRVGIRPVNFAVDHGSVLVRTGHGSFVERLAGSPVVFEADGADPVGDEGGAEAWSVIVEGSARAVLATAELVETFGVELFPWHDSPKPVFVRVEPTSVTGRRFVVTDPSVWTTRFGGLRPTAPD